MVMEEGRVERVEGGRWERCAWCGVYLCMKDGRYVYGGGVWKASGGGVGVKLLKK